MTPPKSSGAVPRPPSVPKGTGRGAESATASGWAVPFRPGSGTGCNRASCGGGLPGVAPRPFGTPATTLRLWERRGGGPLGRQARRVTRRPRRPHLAKRARAAPPATRRSRLRRLHGVLRAAARATARVRKHSGGAPARTQSSRHRSGRPSVLRRGYRQWTGFDLRASRSVPSGSIDHRRCSGSHAQPSRACSHPRGCDLYGCIRASPSREGGHSP